MKAVSETHPMATQVFVAQSCHLPVVIAKSRDPNSDSAENLFYIVFSIDAKYDFCDHVFIQRQGCIYLFTGSLQPFIP